MKDPFQVSGNIESQKPAAPLEWEESALDAVRNVEGFVDEHRLAPRLGWLTALIVIAAFILVGRLFILQIIRGQSFGLLAEGNRLRSQTILAPRGLVYDRNGVILVDNIASFSLAAVPIDLPKQGLEDELIKLANLLQFDSNEISSALHNADKNSFEAVILKRDISTNDRILFETRSGEFSGFSIRTIPVRHYPNPQAFSHVLGYDGIVSREELSQLAAQLYESSDFTGKTGIELTYENYLRGTNGQQQVEVDALGKPVKVVGTIDPKPGNSLELNIDKGLQEQLYNSFKRRSGSPRGAAIALNPKNGEVLALLSIPGFDNNLFARGISQTDYQELTGDKNLPLFNRAIAGTYPPGSTIKITAAVAALQEQVVDEHTVIVDRGSLVIPNQFDPSKTFIFYGWNRAGLGSMTIRSAIAKSSDIYFYTVAGGYISSDVEGLGPEKLASYYRKFGMGSATGIDLQGEKPGLVADPAWKAESYKGDAIQSKWYLGDTYHIGIGQGDMLATPIQVAEWTAVIAAGGVGYRPTILRRVADSSGKTMFQPQPQVIIQKFASGQNIKIVQEAMEETVKSGSGVQLASLPVCAAGKTGTSQFDAADPKRTHAWFTVYAPCNDPQIVLTVLAEAGGEGHAVAVPIAKDVLLWWARNRLNNP